MKLSLKAVTKVKDDFIRKYWRNSRTVYIVNVGVSSVSLHDNRHSLRSDDYCIAVLCNKPLPKRLSLPERFLKVRVFVKISPEPIVAQRTEKTEKC